ncbi:MAG: DUF362 domain-containing protein [Candidatus Binatia bacterium]
MQAWSVEREGVLAATADTRLGCTRRQVLRAGAAMAATAVTGTSPAIGAAAAGEPIEPLPSRPPARVAVVGVPHAGPFGTLARAIREAALAATDFSWLGPGQRVLLKVVCNSPNPYPAVTHAVAVTVMANLLRERGATVYVGDQSGVQFVHHTRQQQRGSTRACMRSAGLERAAVAGNASVVCFEEAGYDGYFSAEPPAGTHFKHEIFLPTRVREVDHIIYLPRVSKHVIAGSTLGLKAAVGWLREDSRLELHRLAASFLEKCADINGCREIRERLRLVLSVGTQVQTSFGPDSGHVATPDVGLVIASENLIDHDLAACAYLLEASERSTPWRARVFDPYPLLSSLFNRIMVSYIWGTANFVEVQSYDPPRLQSPWSCRVLRRGCEIFGRPQRLAVENVNGSVPQPLLDAIVKRAAFPA